MGARHRGRRRRPSNPPGDLGGRFRATIRGHRLLIAVIGLVLPLGAAGALMARRSAAPRSAKERPAHIRPESSSPQLSKEYIYDGARLIATEENGSGSSCSYPLTPTSNPNVPSGGGQYSVNVNPTPTTCSWTAASNVTWITVTSPTGSVTGSGQVNYTVAQNTSQSSQTGTITIAGQAFTVTEAGASCTYSISPQIQNFTSSGGTSSFNVTAGTGCAWTAVSTATWITITSPVGGNGSGNGSVGFSVAPNTGASARSANITLANQTFTVNEDGPCTYNIMPSTMNFPASGGTSVVNITTAPHANGRPAPTSTGSH
jgi:hypothetical protein